MAKNQETEQKTPEAEGMDTSLLNICRFSAEYLVGIVDSSAKAFRTFNDSLPYSSNSFARWNDGFNEGFVKGNSEFFGGMATTAKRAEAHFKTSATSSTPPVEIDYEKLAKMVAAEMKNKS